jgi:hypothetical protein
MYVWLTLCAALVACGSTATPSPAPASSTPPPELPPDAASGLEPAQGCAESPAGCELELGQVLGPLTSIAVDARALYLAGARDVFELPHGATEPKKLGPSVDSMVAPGDGWVFVASGLGPAEHRVTAHSTRGEASRNFAASPGGNAFARGISRQGDFIVWAAVADGGASLFGVISADGSREVVPLGLGNGVCDSAAIVGDDVFSCDGDALMRAKLTSPNADREKVFDGPALVTVAADATDVYFVSDARLYAMPAAGGSARVLAPVRRFSTHLTVRGDTLFWSSVDNPNPAGLVHVYAMPKSGGAPREVFVGDGGRGAFAVDDRYIYTTVKSKLFRIAR